MTRRRASYRWSWADYDRLHGGPAASSEQTVEALPPAPSIRLASTRPDSRPGALTIALPLDLRQALQRQATFEGRTPPAMAARLIELALRIVRPELRGGRS